MTRREFAVLLSLAVLLCAPACLFAPSGPAEPASPARVLCFGDSITFGYSASNPDQTSYPALLQKLLDARHPASFKVINSGVSGETTRQGLVRLDAVLADKRPQWVLLMYGTNDLWSSRKVSLEDTEKNLKEMIAKMKASGARVLISTLLPVWEEKERVAARNDVIRRVAASEAVVLVDLNAAYEDALAAAGGRENRASWEKYYALEDGGYLHPNDEGNKLLAGKWLEALEKETAPEPVTATLETRP